jgi:aspartate/methionine/tyrosine aminotransferase
MRVIDHIKPFRVMQLLERARELEAQGRSIIHMEVGEPDFPLPESLRRHAHEQLDSIHHGYTPSTGLPALQQALADWYSKQHACDCDPQRILITPGTSAAFNMLYHVLLDAGSSVLLPDPGYPCQRNFVRLAGGQPIAVAVDAAQAYHLSTADIAQHWQQDTRAAVLINPSNPTGTVVHGERIAGLASACAERGGLLISDEIYHGLYDDVAPPSALSLHDRVIVVNGFSKRWAMTGWRVGWVIVPEALIEPCRRVMQNIFIAAPTLSQHLAIAALSLHDELEEMRQAYNERRRFLLTALRQLGFGIPIEPHGAFYIYADISAFSNDADSFCHRMLEDHGVAITPGTDFGDYRAKQHVRFSYATALPQLQEGISRLQSAL